MQNLPTAQIKSMSSLEIAELTGKEHKNVLADLRVMFEALQINSAEFSAQYKDRTGRSLPCFNMPKRECLILVSGYSIPMRAAIIDRWQELEHTQVTVTSTPESVIGNAAQILANLLPSVDKSLLAAKTLNQIQDATGVALPHLIAALPARTDERPTMNATQAGALVGLSARKFNLEMAKRDMQFMNGRKEWELTEKGMRYGEQKPYERRGHTGYQVMWFDSVADLFN